jgi:hypothetical protein
MRHAAAMHRRAALLLTVLATLSPEAGVGDQARLPDGDGEAAFAGPGVPVEALAAAIGAWLGVAYDLPRAPLPAIRFSSSAAMTELYRGADAVAAGGRAVVALYDRQAQTIHLPQGWTGSSVAELSMLVHEMVHHLQQAAGHRPACPAQGEALAYEAQARWLAEVGVAEPAVDPLFVKLLAVCGF